MAVDRYVGGREDDATGDDGPLVARFADGVVWTVPAGRRADAIRRSLSRRRPPSFRTEGPRR